MTAQSAEILIVTAVWGDWHVRAFLDVNLPTLLASGNFPALFEKHHGRYQIFTRSSDVARIRDAPTFQHLTSLVPVDLQVIEDENRFHDPIQTHVDIWRDAVAEATRTGMLALMMPPDVLWSDGSFAYVAELLRQGKRGIYASFMRVTSNSFLPAFHGRFGERPHEIALSGKDLVALSLEHLHPVMAAHSRSSRYFPYHCEMAIWPVSNEGLAVRVFARELLIYDPRHIRLNVMQLITGTVPWDELHMVSDSDHLFGVSLTPFGKDASWHRMPWHVRTQDVARWWLRFDSLANDFVAGVQVRWHFRSTTEALWRRREIGANLFTRRAALEREAIRVVAHIFKDRSGRAVRTGRLLALLVLAGKAARALRGLPRLQSRATFVFIPEDDALGNEQLARCTALVDLADGHAERIVRDHVAIAPEGADSYVIDHIDKIKLEFLNGVHRVLAHSHRGLMIDDVPISRMERASAALVVCYTRALLSPAERTAAQKPGRGIEFPKPALAMF